MENNKSYKEILNPIIRAGIQKFFDIMIPNKLSSIYWEEQDTIFCVVNDDPGNAFYIMLDDQIHYRIEYDGSIYKHFETNPLAIHYRDFYQRIDSLEQATDDNFKFKLIDTKLHAQQNVKMINAKLSKILGITQYKN